MRLLRFIVLLVLLALPAPARAAVTFIQSAAHGVASAGFSSTVASGDLILAVVAWDSARTFVSLTDNLGNTYTQIGSELSYSAGGRKMRAFWAQNGSISATATITLTLDAAPTFVRLFLADYRGQLTPNPIDSSSFGVSNSTTPSIGISTVASNVVVVAVAAEDSGQTALNTTTGFTSRFSFPGQSLWDNAPTGYASPGPQTVTWSTSGTPAFGLFLVGLVAAPTIQRTLTWTDLSTTEDGFAIQRCTGSSCSNFVDIATVGPVAGQPNQVTYVDQFAPLSACWRVRSTLSGSGDGCCTNTFCLSSGGGSPPSQVQNFRFN